ncbi:MAG: hypothetical protein ACRCXC_12110 [Legionella sp.]
MMWEKISDTAEFNFYGAHQIDFSRLVSITTNYTKEKYGDYVLNMTVFQNQLNLGNLEALEVAKEKIPEIFHSYRFVDYLLSKTTSEIAKNALQEILATCDAPSLMCNNFSSSV